jgi:hypothetical protein
MNEQQTSTITPRPILRDIGDGDSLRSGIRGPHSTSAASVSGVILPGVNSSSPGRQEGRQHEHVRSIHHGPSGSEHAKRSAPRWHKIIERYPNFIGYTGFCGALALAFHVIQMIV